MVFLNPAILLGLLAASIPILIHLLNFRKLKKVEFSSVSFLKELQKSKIKKIKIKQWLLLFLRTLLIILLVLAFARPTFEGTNIISSASAKSSTIFVLDNSLSMTYLTDKGTKFNQSKKIIKEIITNIDEGNDFYFITTSDSVKNTTNKNTALKFLEEIKITQLTKPLSKTIEEAKSILTKAQNINKEIFVFSDFQKNTFYFNIDSVSSDENIKIYSFDISEQHEDNFSVSNLVLNNAIIEVDKSLNFSADVSNYSENNGDNLSLSLFVNNERVSQKNISIPSFQTNKVDFETTLKSTGLIEAKVVLEDDNLVEDNSCYLNFEVLDKINILLLYENVDDIQFLNSAIKSVSTSERFEITQKPINNIAFLTLNNFDIIFIVTSGNINTDKIHNYLLSNGKVVIFPNDNPDINKFNILLAKINLKSVQKYISTENTNLNYAEFGFVDFSHPLFKSLFPDKNKQQIESPNIYRYLQFTDNQKLNSIIKLNNENIFLGETEFQKGKIILFATSPKLQSGNFPIKSIFAPLITRIILYSTTNQENQNFIVGDIIPLDVRKYNFPVLEIIAPNFDEKINLQNLKNDKFLFRNTQISGSYKFYNNKKLLDFANVNLNPDESDLRKIEIDSLRYFYEKLFNQNFTFVKSNEDYLNKIKNARFGTELWKLFLLLAFLIALLEMFVARSSKKDLMNFNQN
ncbi:MAG: BatA and WFA domain-containing protein [Ignavibacteriae bacterium]|nr:BatA and WFA domain-containing protein [Ignavibacteriota bacterium]